jgi:queuine tRNA-ribosyltransferase
MLGARLGTIHNLHYYHNLMSDLRTAIDEGNLAEFVAAIASVYAGAES